MRTFERYIAQVLSLLCEGMTQEQRNKTGCYDFTQTEIYKHESYFKNSFKNKMPPDEALIYFYDYLHEL